MFDGVQSTTDSAIKQKLQKFAEQLSVRVFVYEC
jgi:hypothetical protein